MIDSLLALSQVSALFDDVGDRDQWIAIVGCMVAAVVLTFVLSKTLLAPGTKCSQFCRRFFNPGRKVGMVHSIFALCLWSIWAVRNHSSWPNEILHSTTLLVSAFAVYRLADALTKGNFAPRFLGGGLLLVFTLQLFGWLEPIANAARAIKFPIGGIEVNIWAILSGIGALLLLLWLASLGTRFVEAGVRTQSNIPPSIRVLISKASRLIFYLVAIIWALKIGGIDLGALAFFGGAFGLGLGFGLQKVISNLVSGVIILLDKSIKPGDVIEIDGTYGWINTLRTRYVSVITRDRKEYLIPNEDFVTNQVTNWSFTDTKVRIRADIGVSYDCDVRLAIKLCTEAAESVSRVLNYPEPNCLLMGFGDSAVNLQLRFWIDDAHNGVGNIRSQVLLAVWDRFQEHGISIPYPQQDLHIKSNETLAAVIGENVES